MLIPILSLMSKCNFGQVNFLGLAFLAFLTGVNIRTFQVLRVCEPRPGHINITAHEFSSWPPGLFSSLILYYFSGSVFSFLRLCSRPVTPCFSSTCSILYCLDLFSTVMLLNVCTSSSPSSLIIKTLLILRPEPHRTFFSWDL